MERPLVSVVIPCYNASQTVGNAIMSIMNQTYENWELILVDDGSDDVGRLFGVADSFNDGRISFYGRPHLGVVESRMYGYRKARGSIIAVQDADDLSMPDRLERAVGVLNGKADIFVHGLYTNLWDHQFNTIVRHYRQPKTRKNIKKALLKEQCVVGVPVFKKHVVKKNPLWKSTKDVYDWAMYLDWVYAGYTLHFEDQGLYEYVRHQNSLSERNERSGRRADGIKNLKRIMKRKYNVELTPIG